MQANFGIGKVEVAAEFTKLTWVWLATGTKEDNIAIGELHVLLVPKKFAPLGPPASFVVSFTDVGWVPMEE